MVLRVRLDTLLSKRARVRARVTRVLAPFILDHDPLGSTWLLRRLLRRWQFHGLPILTNIRLHYFVCHRARFRSDDPRVSRFLCGPRSARSFAEAADESAQKSNAVGEH